MASHVLNDCLMKLKQLMVELENTQIAYDAVRDAASANPQMKYAIGNAEAVLHIESLDGKTGSNIPIAIPAEYLGETPTVLLAAKAYMGDAVVQLWNGIYELGRTAKNHCDRAVAQSMAQDAENTYAPAAPIPAAAPLPPSPAMPAPRMVPQPIPRLNPVATVEVPSPRGK